MAKRKMRPVAERFWEKVDIGGSDDCWLWTASTSAGYGSFWTSEKTDGAHRYQLEQKMGRVLLDGEFCLHTCDNKLCVNPDHLYCGSAADNSRDMVKRGRKESGSDVYGSKLTDGLVLRIRQMYATGQYTSEELAIVFDITGNNILHVVNGRTWRHVGGPIDSRSRKEKAARGARSVNHPDYVPQEVRLRQLRG